MNKRHLLALAAGLALAIGSAPAALAAPTVVVQGGPYTGLDPAGADIHFGFGNFPTDHGLYLFEAVQPAAGARPTIYSADSQVWVSNDPTAPASPKGDVKVHVAALFNAGAADCSKVGCGIFVRLDHTASTDTSQDQFIPITFAAASAVPTTAALPSDTISVTVNGVVVAPNVPGTLNYRSPITFVITTSSGAAVTLKSYTPECALTGTTITALKGAGQCDIAVTSPGGATAAPKTSHYPFNLAPGVQTSTSSMAQSVRAKKIVLAKLTNFGEKISYKSSSPKVCTVAANNVKVLKSGTCILSATAGARNGLFGPYSAKISLAVTK